MPRGIPNSKLEAMKSENTEATLETSATEETTSEERVIATTDESLGTVEAVKHDESQTVDEDSSEKEESIEVPSDEPRVSLKAAVRPMPEAEQPASPTIVETAIQTVHPKYKLPIYSKPDTRSRRFYTQGAIKVYVAVTKENVAAAIAGGHQYMYACSTKVAGGLTFSGFVVADHVQKYIVAKSSN